MSAKVTIPSLVAKRKASEPVVCLTAYDATIGEIADASGVDIILVGDSLGNVIQGHETTVMVTLPDMVYHTRAVRRGVKRALLVADLPFGSYQSGLPQALESSVALMQAGAEAVKLEGPYPELVRELTRAGIPVMGHVGMTPQSVHLMGGFRTQGKGPEAAAGIQETAVSLDLAGAFGIVLELIPPELAASITAAVGCHTIGIGAGSGCSGQIQVVNDVLGLGARRFRHAKAYLDGRALITEALARYTAEVREQTFPGDGFSG